MVAITTCWLKNVAIQKNSNYTIMLRSSYQNSVYMWFLLLLFKQIVLNYSLS